MKNRIAISILILSMLSCDDDADKKASCLIDRIEYRMGNGVFEAKFTYNDKDQLTSIYSGVFNFKTDYRIEYENDQIKRVLDNNNEYKYSYAPGFIVIEVNGNSPVSDTTTVTYVLDDRQQIIKSVGEEVINYEWADGNLIRSYTENFCDDYTFDYTYDTYLNPGRNWVILC